jgi:hypothetical protein
MLQSRMSRREHPMDPPRGGDFEALLTARAVQPGEEAGSGGTALARMTSE